jgi:hypothetical protein
LGQNCPKLQQNVKISIIGPNGIRVTALGKAVELGRKAQKLRGVVTCCSLHLITLKRGTVFSVIQKHTLS